MNIISEEFMGGVLGTRVCVYHCDREVTRNMRRAISTVPGVEKLLDSESKYSLLVAVGKAFDFDTVDAAIKSSLELACVESDEVDSTVKSLLEGGEV